MTEYWFPNATTDAFRAMNIPDQRVAHVHVFCGPCGSVEPRRLAHFVRPIARSAIGVKRFIAEGQPNGPGFWLKKGKLRWRLMCPSSHNAQVDNEKIAALLDNHVARVSLWPDGRLSA